MEIAERKEQIQDLLYDLQSEVEKVDLNAQAYGVQVKQTQPYKAFVEKALSAVESATKCSPAVLLDVKALTYHREHMKDLYEGLGLRTTAKEV